MPEKTGCRLSCFFSAISAKSIVVFVFAFLAALTAAGCTITSGQWEAAGCSNGVAVEDPLENPALVADCAILLGVRDQLAGEATLNWGAQISIEEWEGVSVDSGTDSLRVIEVQLNGRGLTGEVPAGLGELTALEGLWLQGNRLTGKVPAELGALANLEWLWFFDNRLTGSIPRELSNLSKLQGLGLHEKSSNRHNFLLNWAR